jgi:hypothetical protein
VNNKNQVKKVATAVLAVVAFSLFAYGAWGFADWFLGSGVRERQEIGQLTLNWTDYGFFRQAASPEPMITQSATVLSAGEGKYDMIARVSNPNQRWWMEFDYRFTGPGFDDKYKKGFLMPSDTVYLYSLAVEAGAKPAVNLEISNLMMRRVDNHIVQPDYRTWATERIDFEFEDIGFKKPDPNSPIPISRAAFKVNNDTAFGYVSVPFFVTLLSGNRVVGVNRTVISELRAGEIREVEVSWFNDLPNVTRVEVKPELNLFDPDVYLKPGE